MGAGSFIFYELTNSLANTIWGQFVGWYLVLLRIFPGEDLVAARVSKNT